MHILIYINGSEIMKSNKKCILPGKLRVGIASFLKLHLPSVEKQLLLKWSAHTRKFLKHLSADKLAYLWLP